MTRDNVVRLPKREPAPKPERARPHDPARRGYVIRYQGAETPCPGCGRSHWYVGRLSAECAFCAAAIPLAGSPQ